MPFLRPLGEREEQRKPPHFIRPLSDKRAVVGERVVLECQLEGHPDPMVKWLKDGHNVSNCPDYKIEQDGLKHRLIMSQVHGADSGQFSAQAVNAAGTKISTCILIVAPAPTPIPGAKSIASPAPPQTPVGPSAPIFLKEIQHQPLKPGAVFTMEARVAGNPLPQLEWLKNGKPLNNYRAKTEHDPVSGICALVIPQMFADDAGEYACRATNQHGEAVSVAQLLPKEQYDRWFSSEQTKLTRDRKQYMLSQQQQQQQQRPASTTSRRGYGTDTDTPWGVSESETEPELSALDSRHGAKPIIRQPLRGLRLTEGTDAILQANIVGNPKPRVSWLKDGRPFNLAGTRMNMVYKGAMAVLKMSMVSADDSGEYTLIAENTFGKVSTSARIEVYPLGTPDPSHRPSFEEEARAQLQLQAQQQQLARQAEQLRRQQEQFEHEQRERIRQAEEQERQLRERFEREEQELRRRQAHQAQPYQLQFHEAGYQQQQQPQQQQQQTRSVPWRQQQVYQRPQPVYTQPTPVEQQQAQRYQHVPQQQQQPHHLYTQPSPVARQQQSFDPYSQNQQLFYQQQQQQPVQQQYQQQPFYQQHQHFDNNMPVFKTQQQVGNGVAKPGQQQANGSAKANGGASVAAKGAVAGGAAPAGGVKPPVFVTQPQSVSAKAGDNVVFSAKATGQPLPSLEWQRADGAPIKSGGRVKVDGFADGSGRLVVEKVESGDADTYAVVAKNAGGTNQSRFTLSVLQAQAPTAPQFTGTFQNTTIYEGDSIKLYCKAAIYSSDGTIGEGVSFAWFHDDAQIGNNHTYKIETKGNETTLYIQNATMAEGGWYKCEASNKYGSSPLKGRVVVQSRSKLGANQREQITLRKVDRRNARTPVRSMDTSASTRAPAFEGQIQPLQLIEGQTAKFELKFSPSDDPNLKIAWLHNGKALLASSRVVTLSDLGVAVLEINPVTVFDQGEYTVVAVNPKGEARQTTNIQVIGHSSGRVSATGTASPAPGQPQFGQFGQVYQSVSPVAAGKIIDMPNFHSDLRSQEIFEGTPLHLEAKLTPINDPQLRCRWYKDGKEIQSSDRVRTQLSHGFATLDISPMTADDGGSYTLVAENAVGQGENTAVVIVHPRVELQQHEYARGLDVDDVREIQFAHARNSQQPTFSSQIQSFHCGEELGRSYFEARIQPINDPSLRVVWLKDGQPLPNANRIQTFHNFGVVSLTLHPTYPEDAGTYTCVLHNVHGEAQSSAELTTMQSEPLQTDTRHEQSLAIIGYLDGHQVHIGPQAVDRPEEFHSMQPPTFARRLAEKIEVNENDPVHFECRLQPASDVKMTVEWYHNGAPLAAAHRFRPMFDFGYVALDILYAYPEDSGTYTLVARNELGETSCDLQLSVNTEKNMYTDPLHPEGLSRIQDLEQNRIQGLPEIEDRTCDDAPHFMGELQDLELNEHDQIHLDLKVTPVNDPSMVVEWFVNGRPLLTGSRVKTLYEFGFIALDIKHAIAEDSGTYTVKVTNALGEAIRQCDIRVLPAGTILLDTQHEDSLGKINTLENMNKYGRTEVDDAGPAQPPQFVVQLPGNMGEVEEGEPLHLECQVKPYNDNSLRITWLKDGHPLPTGHRFRTFYDFGFVSLDILGVYSQDTGTYTCVAENALGKAETTVEFVCQPKDAILSATQHPASYARIQEIEAPKAGPEEQPEQPKMAPQFVKPLGPGVIELNEGDSAFLEAQYIPTDDNTLTYEWLLNGHPLMKAHRYVLSQDFGYIALNILYCYPEDSGTYTLIVRNAAGEAQTSVDIKCAIKGNMYLDSFHPASIARIAELETPAQRAEQQPEGPKVQPSIVKALPPSFDNVHESQTLHLEAQISPIDDNTLRTEWLFNGQPLKHSSRYRVLNDFGFASLDIDYVISDDAGDYTLRVSNEAGQAETTTRITVEGLKGIVSDTAHPESLRRIQEMEQLRPAEPSEPEAPPQPPVFTKQLEGPTDVLKEGQSVHMDCVVQPINDPNLVIEWFCGDRPLQFGSRLRTIHDFGYVGLEFKHVHPEDTGMYICRARNAAGEAVTQFPIECKERRNLYLDSQHESSWARIQEIEAPRPPREATPDQTFPPPVFTEQLQDIPEAVEADAIRLECRLEPINDPTMRVWWTREGQPLPNSSRFMPRRDLNLVQLDILALYGEDSGQYECHAVSAFGEAHTQCQVNCRPTDSLLLNTQHEQSWQRVQEIENKPVQEIVDDDLPITAPRFVQPLAGAMGEMQEGVPIHLECQVEPTNDNKLRVHWLHNGQPLANGHRFRTTHDFGYVSLDILYAFAQDSGEWTCVAVNELGEAQTVASFNILPSTHLHLDTQHPQSWQRIQEIEAPKAGPEEAPEVDHGAPSFTQQMEGMERIEFQPAHFETRVAPTADPRLRIHWLKDGQPLHNSNRFKHTHDFGYVALDIAHTVPEDSGEYTCVATNDKGESKVSAPLTVRGNASILGDTQHEASWQRIQEIEAPKEAGPGEAEPQHGPPKFVRQLNSVDGLVEGQPAHFEAQFVPFTDPQTTVQWLFNGRPLPASNKMITRHDFGLVTLDLQYALGSDAGEYTCIVKNTQGEDRTSGKLACESRASLLLDTQHEKSWQRIQELEAPREAAPEPAAPVFDKPSFLHPLQSVELPEGGVALLEAKVVPVNDPGMRIDWFFNDQPLAESNWIAVNNDFGCVSLRIAPAHTRHSGVYSCKASNANGAAVTSATVTVQGSESLLLDTAHPDSLRKIQELEALDKYARIEAPDREFEKPQWIQPFANVDMCEEGQVVELHGLVEPSGDPNLRVEWLLNGTPLMNANRFRQELEFGNAILTIVHTLPHDSGVYTCRAWNAAGEASTSATVKVAGYERILADAQHPVSWQRIQELEAPKIVEEVEEVVESEVPRFLTQLESATDVPEGSLVHLEATFQPVRDNSLKVTWLRNDQPIGASQLVQTRNELGWATLDILMVNPDHNGIYSLHIANDQGEAVSSASVKVLGSSGIIGDTRHEESWKQIQILEAPKEAEPEAPAPVFDPPQLTSQLADADVQEGEPVHFEATFVPVNDPNLQVQWLRNGQPLGHGNKYAMRHDFGISQLDIAYAFPEDAGVYQLRVWNASGEAVSSATLKCAGKDALLLDTQHEQSWQRIQEIEAPRPQMEEADPTPKGPPRFVTPLAAPGDLFEGQPAHFEATVEPIDDPQMQILWFLNGTPMAASSRVKMINDFGWAIMDINQTETRDSGEWKCVARNAAGEAECSATLTVQGKESIVFDSMQPQSLDRIREIEAEKPAPEEAPEVDYGVPTITSQLAVSGGAEEGASVHLQAQFTPVNDPSVKVEWLRDGQPLFHSNRYKMVHDFGFAILEILGVAPHDNGVYTLRVSNSQGQAETSAPVQVEGRSGLLLHPQNEAKAKAVEVLEENLNRRPEETEEELKESIPVFIEPLGAPVECAEGDRAHFAARYEPVNDNQLQVQWFHDGRPLRNANRVKSIADFGCVVLEIYPVYPEDSGEYTCRAVNRVGEAVTSTKLTCTPKERVISSSQLPERMSGAAKRIAEIEAPRPLPEDQPDVNHGPPKFTTKIASPPELQEGERAHLEAQVVPVADPKLQIEWFKDGQPMRNSARMKMIHDFGFVVLELCPAEPQDTGKWVCRATNEHGSDECECDIKVVGSSGVSYEWQSPAQRKERITELEDWVNRPKEELTEPAIDHPAPSFTQNLEDLGKFSEADAAAFTCVLDPIGDPTLRVEWLHNGHAIPYSNRITYTNEFGVATLLIKQLISQDSGEYTCIATNSKGRAETVGKIEVESLEQVDAPQVIQPLVDSIDATEEGDSIHLETRITPINDTNLKVYWLKDGQPLAEASRFRPSFEFGFVTLDILYAYPEDCGDYELVAVNDKGEARTKTRITVLPKASLDFAPQVHGSAMDALESHFRQHSQLDMKITPEDAFEERAQRPPEFKMDLQNCGVLEGEFCRFETQVVPVNDPYMRLEWYKDKQPVLLGHRFRSTLDFGFAALDLLYALPDDTGEYTCVATNKYGQAMISAKLACQGASHVITESQMPQGMLVSNVKKANEKLHWSAQGAAAPRKKAAPQFTIKPRALQVTENEPARFECALVGNPKPKVTWFINGHQALHGHRYKLNYDGIYYLTINNCRISDAGEVVAIAKNSEGETIASCSLDIFQKKDFRQTVLKPAQFMTADEVQQRNIRWHKETMGQLGEAFEAAPRPDARKLVQVENLKTPLEPLESEELMQKFTRERNEQFFDQLAMAEMAKGPFEGMKLEDVALKAGTTNQFQPTKEQLPAVNLKNIPTKKTSAVEEVVPDWHDHGKKLGGHVESRFKRTAEVAREVEVPARDTIQLKMAKPTRAEQVNEGEHVKIASEKARLKTVTQAPEKQKEDPVPHKKQVQLKSQQPKAKEPIESVKIDAKPLKKAPQVEKKTIPESTISNKPTPTKIGQSAKAPPTVSQQLKPVQAEVGKSARFFVAFDGALPIKCTWFKDGKELKSTFEHSIKTTNTGSTLDFARLKDSQQGEYMCRLENMAGTVESAASLAIQQPVNKGKAPDFSARLADQRVQQGQSGKLECTVSGEPAPTVNWFKDGQPLPNDARLRPAQSGTSYSLELSGVLPTDAGVYECVAKNAAGEARCKARVNVNLSTTGSGTEAGPRLEAPRFAAQIQPVIANEGQPAAFTAKYTGDPEPMIRWYRNNEPVKKSQGYEISQSKGEATLRIPACVQEHVAEYKVEASNPAGKASSVANLVITPKSGRIVGTTITRGSTGVTGPAPARFLAKMSDVTARTGHSVKFTCEIDGEPQPTVQWTVNGRPLYAGRDVKISLSGNLAVLELARVGAANAGDYVCTIRNPGGSAQCQAKLTIAKQ